MKLQQSSGGRCSRVVGVTIALAVASACAIATGCLSSPRPEEIIYQNSNGAVTLKQAADRSFQATHPSSLSPAIVARVLRGVRVDNPGWTIQALFSGSAKTIRAFSDEEVQFLTPLLVEALSKASPAQQVRFRVIQPANTYAYSGDGGAGVGTSKPLTPTWGFATTEGTLYIQGRSLYFTLTQFQYRPEKPDTINMPNRRLPDTTGLDRREVSFVPEIAGRPDTSKKSGLFGDAHPTTLMIDYELLAALPDSQLEPKSAEASQPQPPIPAETGPGASAAREQEATRSEEMRSLKELIIKKDMELEVLKEEVRTLKRRLGGRESDPQAPK